MRKLICSLLLSTLALSAGEISGKWTGSFESTSPDGDAKAETAYLDLKEQKGDITGTAGPNAEKQWPVQKGKLDGKKLTFEVEMEDGGHLVFDLTFDGESIQGTCDGEGHNGEKMSAKLLLKRTD